MAEQVMLTCPTCGARMRFVLVNGSYVLVELAEDGIDLSLVRGLNSTTKTYCTSIHHRRLAQNSSLDIHPKPEDLW